MPRPMAKPHVFDVTTRGFETEVLARSRSTPILLDFWAAWCGPCRQLGPVLESLAEQYGGAFVLGKVDTEAERDLAYAFGVQGIPFCVLMVGGRPVDAFQGALPEAEVKKFLSAAGIEPLPNEPQVEEPAAPPVDPDSPAERLRAGLTALSKRDHARARERLAGIGEEHPEHAAAQRLIDGLDALAQAMSPGTSAAAQAIERGRAAIAAGRLDDAVQAFLESVAADRGFGAGLARRHAVFCFELLGATPGGEDRVAEYRRRMATLLF